jgi:hypothetical protein
LPDSEREPMRLVLDADVHVPAATALTLRGFDVVSVWQIGREALPDESQLAWASDQGRCLVTFNVGDYTRLHVRWLLDGLHHAGIVVSNQIHLRAFIRRCWVLLGRYSSDALVDQLIWLPKG